ncbi:MAG TPA: flagellar biosynthetic protein FliP, partial [Bacilli bacterium]
MKNHKLYISLLALILISLMAFSSSVVAETIEIPGIPTSDEPADVSNTISILLLITILSIAPSIVVLMTSFTRIIIVLGFVRTALATQQMPPNQVLVGLALFITLFVMAPTISEINTVALQP